MSFKKIFKKEKNIIIGAIHFPPLLGFKNFPGLDIALKNAEHDLLAFKNGGVDAVIIENNYDIPHTEFVGPEITACMTLLAEKIKKMTTLPVGISVLWNDYRTALSIAKIVNLQFIRIPVFVDTVKTQYGIIKGNPEEVIEFRKKISTEHVCLFTDIHVKHSKIISEFSIETSAKLAIKNGADAVIVTGKWTGDAPDMGKLQAVRNEIGDFPILCGSGINASNIKTMFRIADGAIVSTSLKEGGEKSEEINVKGYEQRISQEKARELVKKISDNNSLK